MTRDIDGRISLVKFNHVEEGQEIAKQMSWCLVM